jgi:hypothetical protein
VGSVGLAAMDKPPPDVQKILAYWMEFERGETDPGRLIANLKTAGLPELLAGLAGDREPAA